MEVEYSGNCNCEGSTSKKKKIHGKDNLLHITSDRISDLPDSLLIQILSFLGMRSAFKTCILSKRWETVWTHVENLEFNYEPEEPSPEHLDKFISFVDHILLHCTRTNLKKFSLFSYCEYFDFDDNISVHRIVDKWLHYLFEKNVEIFELIIWKFAYRAPEWFYHKVSFVQLEIYHWEIKILGSAVTWPSLKILVLSGVVIDDEQIAKILLGCPVLEELSLTKPTNVTHLNIMSRSVKKLEMFQAKRCADLLDLNAPWLQEFVIIGSVFSVIPRFINVSSLITAKINLGYVRSTHYVDNPEDLLLDMACKLIESMHYVKELTLEHLFIQALSITKLLGRPTPLFMCKHLTVHLSVAKYDLPGIACLLQSSPNLENFVIEVESLLLCHFKKIFKILHDMDISWIPPSGNTLSLKNAKLIYSYNLCFRERLENNGKIYPEIAVAEYLFKNAPLMGKLVISTWTEDCTKCATKCASHYLSRLLSKFFRVCDDSSEWQVRKKCSTLEISLM